MFTKVGLLFITAIVANASVALVIAIVGNYLYGVDVAVGFTIATAGIIAGPHISNAVQRTFE